MVIVEPRWLMSVARVLDYVKSGCSSIVTPFPPHHHLSVRRAKQLRFCLAAFSLDSPEFKLLVRKAELCLPVLNLSLLKKTTCFFGALTATASKSSFDKSHVSLEPIKMTLQAIGKAKLIK